MSKTKSKVFRIEIIENQDSSLSNLLGPLIKSPNDSKLPSQIEEKLNDFFSNPNHVYISHTSSVLTGSVRQTGQMATYSKEILLIVIYKDLADTSYDLKKVSKKAREIIRSQIEDDLIIEEPDFLTKIDEKILALTKPTKER